MTVSVKMCTLWDAVSLVFPRSMMPVTSPCSVLNQTAAGSAGRAATFSAWTAWWCGARKGEATCINFRQSELAVLNFSFRVIQVFSWASVQWNHFYCAVLHMLIFIHTSSNPWLCWGSSPKLDLRPRTSSTFDAGCAESLVPWLPGSSLSDCLSILR